MADNFGLKIGVEGEKEFKNALRDINQAFKVLGSEMALVSSQFDKNDKSIQALTARNEVLEKSIDAQKEKIETLRAALDNASTSFGENDRRTQNWQIQLNKALAELNGMERELENNHKALRDHADAIDDSTDNMEDAADAANELADNVDDVGDEMDDASKKTSVFGDVLKANLLSDAIIGGVKALGSAIAGIGKAFIGAMKDGVEYNAQMENYTASFTTMLGDEAKAQKLVNDLKKEAAATPFGMQDLAQSAQTLMSFGMSAEEAQKRMKQLGDISQGDAEKFKSLTLAFAQMSSTGKLTGQDLMQMINAGFNPLEEISRKTGKSIGELKDEMSKGAISADMVAEAFASATSEGGRFYGSMEAQSKTFSGQMATLEDGVASLKGQLAEGLTTMLSGTVLPMVNGWVDELSGAFQKDGVQGLIDAFGGILEEAVQFISEQLPIVVDIASQIIISLVQGLTSALPQITEAAVMLLMTLVNGIIETLPALITAGIQMIGTIISGIAEALPQLIPAAVSAVVQIVQGLLDNLPMVLEAALQLVLGLTQGILDALPVLIADLPRLLHYLDVVENSISLFDVPLHFAFQTAATSQGGFDMGSIFNNSLVRARPECAVTFVDNHDTQPGQALASFVPEWFKPIAYAFILLRQEGVPCVFYGDYYGIPHDGISPMAGLKTLLRLRRDYAYGQQRDYLDDSSVVGFTRAGDEEHPDSGMAVLMTDAAAGSKRMLVGKHFAGTRFFDGMRRCSQPVVIDENGEGEFRVNGGSVSVWIPEKAYEKIYVQVE